MEKNAKNREEREESRRTRRIPLIISFPHNNNIIHLDGPPVHLQESWRTVNLVNLTNAVDNDFTPSSPMELPAQSKYKHINTSKYIKSVIPLIDWLTGQQLPINWTFYLASIPFISFHFHTRIFIWMEIHLPPSQSVVKFFNPIIAGTSNWTPLSPMSLYAQSLIGRGTTSTHQISNQ